MDHCEVKPETRGVKTWDLTVCLAGMPNCGKTTLMNALTGGKYRTGNYPGVTVDILKGWSLSKFGEPILMVDLPGVHATVACSPEEELATTVIRGDHPTVQGEVFVVVVDATQLERHLRFAAFVAQQPRPVVIALTMVDLLSRLGQSIDRQRLESALGVRVIAVDGRTGQGGQELLEAVRTAAEQEPRPSPLSQLPSDLTESYREVGQLLKNSRALTSSKPQSRASDPVTERIDRLVLNKYLGFLIFFAVLTSLFAAIFWAAQPFMDGIDWAFTALGDQTKRLPLNSLVTQFLSDGLIAGVGTVVIFFPQVLILFFLMTLLEDSGYLARGAALVDRPLRRIGLHGRSFVPMLSGFACAIPATLAARAVPAKRERLLTIGILPLMSCSARIPVYAMLLGALLPRDAAWRKGLLFAAIYIGSLLAGSLVAGLIGRLLPPPKSELSMLAMELPLYRWPQPKSVAKVTWVRASAYLKRAGGMILIISLFLWVLTNFGFGSKQPVVQGAPPSSFISPSDMNHSFAAQLGQLIEPALRPMGVDWRVGVGLIAAFAAREVFVSSLAIVFQVDGDEDQQQEGILKAMRTAEIEGTGRPVFTTASISGLIVFFLFSLQCLSTVAVVRRETRSWTVAVTQLLGYTGLSYILAVATVQGLHLWGIP
ncbi:MAG TPA: ferrous iron transporter B [Blastocatellia bacterium]|nr:ferrous iron transporter B [Blastocatellia bacterium]